MHSYHKNAVTHTLIDLEHAHADTLHALHVYLGTMYTLLFRAKQGLYSGSIGLCMASLRASKTSFCLSTASQAPSLVPGTSIRVDYLHEGPQQLQVSSCAKLYSPIELFFATSKIVAFSLHSQSSSITCSKDVKKSEYLHEE